MIYHLIAVLLSFSSVSFAEEPRYCDLYNKFGKKVGLVDLKWFKVGQIRDDGNIVAVGLIRSKQFTDNIFSSAIYILNRRYIKSETGYGDVDGNIYHVQNTSSYARVAKIDATQRAVLNLQGEKIGSYGEACESAWGSATAVTVGASFDALGRFSDGRQPVFISNCAQYECVW